MQGSGRQQRSEVEDEQEHRHHGLNPANAGDGNPLGLEDLPSLPSSSPLRWFGLFAFVLISMAMLATVLVVTAAKDKKTSLLTAEEKRLAESVSGRVKILQTWLNERRSTSKRLTDSHVFRLFIADMARQQPASPLPRSLQDQRPYFRQLIADFTRQNNLIRTTVLREDGAILLSSPGPVLPTTSLLQRMDNAKSMLSPVRFVDGRDRALVIDAVVRIPQVQEARESLDRPSALLVLTMPIGQILEEALSSNIADPNLESITLFQQRDGVTDRIQVTKDGAELVPGQFSDGVRPGLPLDFGRRNDGAPVYSLGASVEGLPWTLQHALDARAALSPMHDFIKAAIGFSAMAALILAATFSALWWRQGRNHHRQLVTFYKDAAYRIDQQHRFLQSVMASIGDWLAVCAPNGEIIYANSALKAAIGQPELPASRRSWNDLIKASPATAAFECDLAGLIDAGAFKLVDVEGYRRVIEPHLTDLKTEDGRTQGTVHVVRDHTKLVDERHRRLRAVTQTVDAFINVIELRDPFLLGHTCRVRSHAIAIGQSLGLSSDELASLALAASLSQIGKIFIPDDILTKPHRHDNKEEEVMRAHILHAIDVLQRIDFDLPIVDILASMHERLDGSGYPHGLVDDEIGLSARILGVADVFCARTAPRSYRDRISAGKTLYHLASNGRRYDLKVVAALADIVGQDHQLDTPGMAEQTFIDAEIWRQRDPDRLRLPETT